MFLFTFNYKYFILKQKTMEKEKNYKKHVCDFKHVTSSNGDYYICRTCDKIKYGRKHFGSV